MRALVDPILWFLTLTVVAGCGSDEPPSSTPRLLDDLKRSLLEVADLADVIDAATSPPLIQGDPVAEGRRWYSLRYLADGRVAPLDAGALEARDVDGHPAMGVHASHHGVLHFLPAPPEGSLEVTVRARSFGDVPARMSVHTVDQVPSGDPEEWARRARDLLVLSTRREVVGRGGEGMEEELRLVQGPNRKRQALMIILYAGNPYSTYADLTVRELTPLEQILADDTGEDFEHPLRRKVSIGESVRDCLILPAASRVTFEKQIPNNDPILEFAFGARGPVGESVGLSLSINEQLVQRNDYALSGREGVRPFADVTVDLSPWAGQTVTLSFAIRGDANTGGVGLLAHPWIVSRDGGAHPRPKNLILLSLDTLRPDRLSAYGYEIPTSPRLEQLAERGIRFSNVLSPSSYTLPTHTTMLSGQHPFVHGVRKPTDRIDTSVTPLIADELRREGYWTAAFTGGGFVDPTFGFDHGFDRYDVRDPGAVLSDTVRDRVLDQEDPKTLAPDSRMKSIVQWMKARRGAPFFLFVHTYLTHEYRPAPGYLEQTDRECQMGIVDNLAAMLREPGGKQHLSHLYDATVLQADDLVLGTLLDGLRDIGIEEETVVAVVSDHGEELYEHGDHGHGDSLHEEVVRIPWVLYDPEGPRGVVVDDLVGLDSVAPTLRRCLNLESDASDVGPTFGEPSFEARESYLMDVQLFRDRPHQALRLDRWKLTLSWKEWSEVESKDPVRTLVDLIADPSASRNLVDSTPSVVERLESLLVAQREALTAQGKALGRDKDLGGQASDVLRQRLAELGYVDE